MQRVSLEYVSKEGTPVVLYNLGQHTAEEIIRVQRDLGSSQFTLRKQPHNFSQQDIDLLRSDWR